MSEEMAELHLPLLGRRARREARGSTAADPLREMATRMHELDEVAARTSTAIAEAARSLQEVRSSNGSPTRAQLEAGLARALVERTDEIRFESARLAALIERSAVLIADREPGADAARPRPVIDLEPAAERQAGNAEGVRLLATQLSLAGASRAEVARRLRVQFGVRDADDILDELFDPRARKVEP